MAGNTGLGQAKKVGTCMPEKTQYVLSLNDSDTVTNKIEKMYAHKNNIKHIAFSVFIYNDNHEMLIQKRAQDKYHSGGLWSNTCCGHPISDDVQYEARERLKYEMGIDVDINKLFSFSYCTAFSHGLYENELDYVYVGKFNGNPIANPLEVENCKWVDYDDLLRKIVLNNSDYTYWFNLSVSRVIEHLKGR